jgi:hypothetical protein
VRSGSVVVRCCCDNLEDEASNIAMEKYDLRVFTRQRLENTIEDRKHIVHPKGICEM